MSDQDIDITVFSRPFEASTVTARAAARQIEANAEERAQLAEVLDLISLDTLTATLSLRRLASGLIEVKGELDAKLVQRCVVTLEPVPAEVHESFRWTFGDVEPEPVLGEIDIDFGDSDPPEPIEHGQIDLGQVVAEELSLGLDPYPRKEGAVLPQEYEPKLGEVTEIGAAATRKPFAGLDKLKK
ncbi:DUF177 domain-containing protein [Dongia sp.]|uniref:DUF177 domain-containing protein n=1 Tax=Dongia sp. TaxID=1977262 RepID=UPI0035B0C665